MSPEQLAACVAARAAQAEESAIRKELDALIAARVYDKSRMQHYYDELERQLVTACRRTRDALDRYNELDRAEDAAERSADAATTAARLNRLDALEAVFGPPCDRPRRPTDDIPPATPPKRKSLPLGWWHMGGLKNYDEPTDEPTDKLEPAGR